MSGTKVFSGCSWLLFLLVLSFCKLLQLKTFCTNYLLACLFLCLWNSEERNHVFYSSFVLSTSYKVPALSLVAPHLSIMACVNLCFSPVASHPSWHSMLPSHCSETPPPAYIWPASIALCSSQLQKPSPRLTLLFPPFLPEVYSLRVVDPSWLTWLYCKS